MTERTKVTVLKTVRGASPSRVRIPVPPLLTQFLFYAARSESSSSVASRAPAVDGFLTARIGYCVVARGCSGSRCPKTISRTKEHRLESDGKCDRRHEVFHASSLPIIAAVIHRTGQNGPKVSVRHRFAAERKGQYPEMASSLRWSPRAVTESA
jgi:hypothetical protein